VKKQLFTGGEDKVCTAVNAFQHPVLEFHCELLRPSESRKRMFRDACVGAPFSSALLPWVRPARTGKCAGYSFGKTLPEMDARLISAF